MPASPARPATGLRSASEWRRVVMPTEHGGWAFLGEPVLLGLLVAPSAAGTFLGAAALAAFLTRQPLRLLAADRRKGRRYPRTAVAEAALALLGVATLAFAAAGILLARGPAWMALAAVAVLGAVAVAFDLARRAREAAAELVAALALGGMASVIALAAGRTAAPSFVLWAILAARTLPSILYVRARLRLERGIASGIAMPLEAHGLALAAIVLLAVRHQAPWLSAFAVALLLVRAAWGLSPARPRWTTAQLGVSEIVFGVVTVMATVAGMKIGM